MDLHKSIMDLHKSIMDFHKSIMDLHKSIMEIHKSIMEIHNQLWTSIGTSYFIHEMSASVSECRSICSYCSTGWCAGLMITGHHFQLLLTLSPSDTKCQ